MKILFALPGLHLIDRGAEIAFVSVATELAKRGNTVTLIGSGKERPDSSYRFLSTPIIRRENFEHFPCIPPFRSEYIYEEASFLPGLLLKYRPADYDVTLTCSYPFTNWGLRRPTLGRRPSHVFITQNGDWPAVANEYEYRLFGCDGLICTNPDYYDRNKDRWPCCVIPNGVDANRFTPKRSSRNEFGLPTDRLIVLMVSALIPTKRVDAGINAVKDIPNAHLVVAGDGPLRDVIAKSAAQLLPGRFTRLSVPAEKMPALYGMADVFLHLSKEESCAVAILEAMASGLPIVGHHSQRWVVGDDEFLIDTDEPTRIASAICAASEVGVHTRFERSKRAEMFSWQKIAASYEEFLKAVVERSNRRG